MPRSTSRGLQQIGDCIHAFVQPDGSWGGSDAGPALFAEMGAMKASSAPCC